MRYTKYGEVMSRRITNAVVEDAPLGRGSGSLHDPFHRKTAEGKGRFGHVLSFLILIGAIFTAFRGDNTTTASSGSGNEKRSPDMSSVAAATGYSREDDEDLNRSILSTVLEQSDSVESDTDDLIERAATAEPKEFRRQLENNVSSLRGFSTSIRGLVKSL